MFRREFHLQSFMTILGVNCIVVAMPDDKLPAIHALGKMPRSLPDMLTDALLSVRFVFKRCSPEGKPHVRFSNLSESTFYT